MATAASESGSSTGGATGSGITGLGFSIGADEGLIKGKRSNEGEGDDRAGTGKAGAAAGEGVKKKRRVALTKVEDE